MTQLSVHNARYEKGEKLEEVGGMEEEEDGQRKSERERENRVQETGRKEVPTRSGPRSRRLPGLEPAQC